MGIATAGRFALEDVPPAPRRPSLRALRYLILPSFPEWMGLLLGAVWFPVGSLMFFGVALALREDFQISLDGEPATGRVTNVVEDVEGRSKGPFPWLITFTYEAGGGRRETTLRTSDRATAVAAMRLEPLEIEVSRSRADWVRIVGTPRGGHNVTELPIVLLVAVLGALAGGWVLRGTVRRWRAFVSGEPLIADVVTVVPTREEGGHLLLMPRFTLEWRFDVDGVRHKGSVAGLNARRFQSIAGLQRIVVLHDRRGAGYSVPWLP